MCMKAVRLCLQETEERDRSTTMLILPGGQQANLESVCLLWLDASANSSEVNLATQKRFHAIIHPFRVFVNVQECELFIRSQSSDDRLFLIVNGVCGQDIVPRLEQYRQLSSIYVYCRDKERNEAWSKHFSKVRGVFVKLDLLIEQITADYSNRGQCKVDEPFPLHVSKSNQLSIKSLGDGCVYSKLFFDVLLRLKTLATDKSDLINICKNEYRNQPDELEIIEDFDENYSSDQALWWYTRESCFSRLLTKALYTKNLTLLSLFGFFIRDIQDHLKANQSPSSVRVYYGQIMSSDELIRLKNTTDHYLLIDRFLSTDLNRAQASQSLNNIPISNDFCRVLFEIEAAPPPNDSERPFADITAFTFLGEKPQVLFMSGSMFHLTAIQQHDKKNRVWIAKLALTDMSKDYDDRNLTRCGQIILDQIGQIDTAEAYFSRLVKEAPEANSADLSNCFHALGFIYFEKHNYHLSLNWYYKAVQTSTWNSLDSADSYYSMGCTYQKVTMDDRALECYQAALNIWQTLPHDDATVEMANCWNNIGCIYEKRQSYHKALECHTSALAIREHLNVDIGPSRNNIGNIYLYLGEYATALEHYQFALEKKKKTLPFRHISIGTTLANIGLVYEYDGDWKAASEYYSKAASIFRELYLPVHIYNVEIQEDIQRVLSSAKFESVDLNLETAV